MCSMSTSTSPTGKYVWIDGWEEDHVIEEEDDDNDKFIIMGALYIKYIIEESTSAHDQMTKDPVSLLEKRDV